MKELKLCISPQLFFNKDGSEEGDSSELEEEDTDEGEDSEEEEGEEEMCLPGMDGKEEVCTMEIVTKHTSTVCSGLKTYLPPGVERGISMKMSFG